MEHKTMESRLGSLARGSGVALACALVCLTICTFLLCNTLVQQLLPVILFVVFALISFFALRTRWANSAPMVTPAAWRASAWSTGEVVEVIEVAFRKWRARAARAAVMPRPSWPGAAADCVAKPPLAPEQPAAAGGPPDLKCRHLPLSLALVGLEC